MDPMQTMRLPSSDDDDDVDPFSFVSRTSTDDGTSLTCFRERVLYECCCFKQSKWLRHWRRRWLVPLPAES